MQEAAAFMAQRFTQVADFTVGLIDEDQGV
jgi:hypothetical protein